MRLIVLLLAITTGGTGFLPSVEGYRCVAMNRAMGMARPCCPKCDPPPHTIGTPCCQRVTAASFGARASAPQPERGTGAPPLIGVVAFSTSALAVRLIRRTVSASSRGDPAGQRLQLFSTILRV